VLRPEIHFERSFPNQNHFFVRMAMRRMRRQTWSWFGDVHFHGEALMRFTVENSSTLVRPVVPNCRSSKA
jgi:hypothetical protein